MVPRRLRPHVAFAVVLLAAAHPARADEVAYLMYVKGSEGPPAAPMRVLWDIRDDANARITIDLGEKYEPVLSKLGLERVLKYDAKREKAQFVVRDLAFTRFVKTVATSVVQALLTASSVAGAWAQPPDAQVQDAALLITPAPRPEPLEIAAWLYVTYLAPQKSGRPKPQDLIKGDLVFVGRPEDAGASETGQSGKP
ncbi:MAG: hypothetical protein WBW74_25805 [Xanthobacteraceae bacterium]